MNDEFLELRRTVLSNQLAQIVETLQAVADEPLSPAESGLLGALVDLLDAISIWAGLDEAPP